MDYCYWKSPDGDYRFLKLVTKSMKSFLYGFYGAASIPPEDTGWVMEYRQNEWVYPKFGGLYVYRAKSLFIPDPERYRLFYCEVQRPKIVHKICNSTDWHLFEDWWNGGRDDLDAPIKNKTYRVIYSCAAVKLTEEVDVLETLRSV